MNRYKPTDSANENDAVTDGADYKGGVPAVLKAVGVLDALAAAREPLTLAALTHQLRLPKSTVHTLCATLVQVGLVRRLENRTYHLGMRFADFSRALLARTDPIVEFESVFNSFEVLPEETIILSVLDGADIVYVRCRNGSRPLGLNFRIGMRLPANCTSTGKALFSTLPDEQIADLARNGGLRSLTQKSVTDLPTLLKQLALSRRRGYSIDDEETREGMMCIGAPVFDYTGERAVAGVGVSLVKSTLDAKQKKTIAAALVELAATLSRRLGAGKITLEG